MRGEIEMQKAPFPLERTILVILFLAAAVVSCTDKKEAMVPLQIPRGYVQVLEIEVDGQRVRVGPFVGYYFKPENPTDIARLRFVCFNERSFYTLDMPENARLFEGEGILRTLPDTGLPLPRGEERIQPVFFPDAADSWLQTRPEPQDEFVHFHSGYDAAGPTRHGYWLRHVATAAFAYDMGGRVGKDSPLFHEVKPGVVDKDFARIVEFDRGPS